MLEALNNVDPQAIFNYLNSQGIHLTNGDYELQVNVDGTVAFNSSDPNITVINNVLQRQDFNGGNNNGVSDVSLKVSVSDGIYTIPDLELPIPGIDFSNIDISSASNSTAADLMLAMMLILQLELLMKKTARESRVSDFQAHYDELMTAADKIESAGLKQFIGAIVSAAVTIAVGCISVGVAAKGASFASSANKQANELAQETKTLQSMKSGINSGGKQSTPQTIAAQEAKVTQMTQNVQNLGTRSQSFAMLGNAVTVLGQALGQVGNAVGQYLASMDQAAQKREEAAAEQSQLLKDNDQDLMDASQKFADDVVSAFKSLVDSVHEINSALIRAFA